MLTLGGFALGVWSYLTTAATWPKLPQPQPPLVTHEAFQPMVMSSLTLALALWAVFEAVRLWRTRPAAAPWTARLLVGPYRLSTAMALIGVANGILYALHGPWTYTRTFNDGVARLMSAAGNDHPLGLHWALFFAVVAGAIVSAWQRGTFRLDWRPSITWFQDIAGGLLMGFGAGMTPGGNDVLVLHDLPQLSGHAVPALLAMIAGITLVMVVMRAATGTYLEVDCQGDVCTSRRIGAPRGAAEPAVATVHDSRSSTASERRSPVRSGPAPRRARRHGRSWFRGGILGLRLDETVGPAGDHATGCRAGP